MAAVSAKRSIESHKFKILVHISMLFRFGNEQNTVHSALYSRMNRMTEIWFTPNRQNMHSFGKVLAGNDTRPAGHPPVA